MKKFCLAFCLFFCSQGLWAADINKAEQLLNNGQADAALIEVEAVLKNDATNADARFIQGLALAQLGRSKEAIVVFKDLTNDYREIPEPYNNLAVLLAQTGDYAGARQALEEATQYHPSYTVAWENLADIYSVMATVAYEKVLELDPRNAVAKQRLAMMSGASQNAAVNSNTAAPSPALTNAPVAVNDSQSLDDVPLLPVAAEVEATPLAAEPAQAGASISGGNNFNAEQQAVMQAVQQWAQAWATQNIEGYIGAYSDNYQPQDNQSRGEWEKSRRSRLAKPSVITLSLSQPSVSFLDDSLVMVKFTQDYRSNSYQDRVRKTLLMERENGEWKIVREQSIR